MPHPLRRALSGLLTTLTALSCWFAIASAQAQSSDTWVVKRDVPLRSGAGDTQAPLSQLQAMTPVTRTGERRGAWIQVQAGKLQGWVHMFDLQNSQSSGTSSSGTGVLRTVEKAMSSAKGTQVATATAGIRGMDATDLAQAQPDTAAMQKAEARQISAAQAEQFASAAKLNKRDVPELPVTAAPKSQ